MTGPTCSGKSALALEIARRFGGRVINADSMQVYADLRILTARPSPEDEAVVPHRLYGVRDAADAGSAAWWRGRAIAEMEAAWVAGEVPILCGGTGLYLHALTKGLTDVPEPGSAARDEARHLLAAVGAAGLHARLSEVDPTTAARLMPTDGQRIARAWEVWRGTGTGLSAWQARPGLPPVHCRFTAVRLQPSRDLLRAALARRFAAMLSDGALEEVARLRARRLDPALPAMRAHGVPELMAHLDGGLTLNDASVRAVGAIGRYVKRQETWFAHHAVSDATLLLPRRFGEDAQQMERDIGICVNFIADRIDASAARA